MSTRIREFWLSHPEYWIAQGDKQAAADAVIYNAFKKYDFTGEDNFGIIIYLDQFMRHFSRVCEVSESLIHECRTYAATIVGNLDTAYLNSVSEHELVWYLMPWKHLKQWPPIFQTINSWLSGKSITQYTQLNRFFMDTYRKAYTTAHVTDTLVLAQPTNAQYNADAVCESHPALYADEHLWPTLPPPDSAEPLLAALPIGEPMTISLSGGVDSMLMAALLKRKGADLVAAHIVYGNRDESAEERKFIETYCQKLGIPLYLYTVEWLRRDTMDRAFYEEMTRQLRFSVYKTLERPVFLGHIQEDAVENVWTNFAKGTHLDDLVKFRPTAVEDGVLICRPWLHIKKKVIYEVAAALAIPHLKNTTPTWSNRGKFRRQFYAATHAQYGEHVDEKVLEVAERIRKQSELLDHLLFQPIRESWNPATQRINVTQAVKQKLDGEGWQRILTDLAHTHLGVGKPSFAAADDFANRTRRGLQNGQIVTLRKDLVLQVCKEGDEVFLQKMHSPSI